MSAFTDKDASAKETLARIDEAAVKDFDWNHPAIREAMDEIEKAAAHEEMKMDQKSASELGRRLLAITAHDDEDLATEFEQCDATRSHFDSFGGYHQERGRRESVVNGHRVRFWTSVQARKGEQREPLTVVEIDDQWCIAARA